MDEKQSDAVLSSEISWGFLVALLVFLCVWGVAPMVVFIWRFPNYFSAESSAVSLIAPLVPLSVWAISGGILFSILYDDHMALHGERLKVACYQSAANQIMLRLPELFVLHTDKPVELRRGDPLPSGITKASRSLVWGVLNVLAVDHVVYGSYLYVEFKGAMNEASKRMVCICLADAIWYELGKPVTFVCRGLPSGAGVNTRLT